MATVTPENIDTIHYHELHRPAASMAAEVHAGLSCKQKSLPPKLFYDKKGSELFDVITRLPEYYPTRTEVGLLRRHAAEMAELLGPRQCSAGTGQWQQHQDPPVAGSRTAADLSTVR